MNLINLYKRFKPNYYQSLKDLSINAGMMTSILYAMWYTKESYMSYVFVPLLSLLQAKSFVIFHDCGHNNFTPNTKLNYMIGTLLGIPLMTPYSWTYDHEVHHKTSGKSDNTLYHRQNETIHHTFTQYNDMNILHKYITKMWRNPYMYFGCFSTFALVVMKFRVDIILDKLYYENKYSSTIYNICIDNIINSIGIFILYSYNILLYYPIIISYVLFYNLILMIFHNQHTFNKPYVKHTKEWTKNDSGLLGSSFILLPIYLKFFMYGIEYHHIHHMISSIPGYNLKGAHEYLEKTEPSYKNIVKLSMKDCYHNLWLTLYDEEEDKYISFKDADQKIKNY